MGKIKALLGNLKNYWNKAPAGRYLSFKEAAAYCVGGMGAVGATVIPPFVTLTAGLYIAAGLGINVKDIWLIGIINSILAILRAPIMSMIIDNTNTKYGKFRPYLIWMPIPIMLCFIGFGFLDLIKNYILMLVIYTIIFNVMQFFMGLYSLAFTTLLQVITPKQSEKEWLMAIGAVVYSFGPTVVNAILPLVANLMYSVEVAGAKPIMGINTFAPYKWLVPLMLLICFALGYLTAFGTKERIVQAKEHKQRVKFLTGVKNTSKNKYFWINIISAVLSVFKLIGSSYVAWLCSYAISATWAQSLFTTLISTAYTPGMILAPIFIKKFGKKNLTIFSNLACVVMTVPIIFACISPGAVTPYLILICSYFIILVNAVQVVTGPALLTQIYDYQQYKTGERLEGFISQYGAIISTVIGMGTSFVLPAIYAHYGYTDNPNVLSQAGILYPIISTTCLLGIISGVLCTIPYFFWDMSEKKHNIIIEILKVRALHDEKKIDDATAKELEAKLEAGEEKALDDYIIEHPLEGSEDFISVKVDGENVEEESQVTNDSLDSLDNAQDNEVSQDTILENTDTSDTLNETQNSKVSQDVIVENDNTLDVVDDNQDVIIENVDSLDVVDENEEVNPSDDNDVVDKD